MFIESNIEFDISCIWGKNLDMQLHFNVFKRVKCKFIHWGNKLRVHSLHLLRFNGGFEQI
jgi:hypothetical protein